MKDKIYQQKNISVLKGNSKNMKKVMKREEIICLKFWIAQMEQQLAEAGKDPEQRSTPFLKEKLSAQNASHKQTTNITHD